eukprot:TRINITY_DN76268_c0_g1_i1.p1 TRINITY_DN76268_c0_g1~~TRINITY_DN76268_c0_g1_i1.p1  ORF type:complete len:658 (+),score=128.74 TRINITY_DN76268_c0_g1_i1:43-2016(+)
MERTLATCNCCDQLVKSLNAPWPWYCSGCDAAFTESEPIYGCPNQSVCQSIDDWGICKSCAESVATSGASSENLVEDASVGAEKGPAGHPNTCSCGRALQRLEAPWPWYCSTCSGSFTEADPIYGCSAQKECQSIDDWGVCQRCAGVGVISKQDARPEQTCHSESQAAAAASAVSGSECCADTAWNTHPELHQNKCAKVQHAQCNESSSTEVVKSKATLSASKAHANSHAREHKPVSQAKKGGRRKSLVFSSATLKRDKRDTSESKQQRKDEAAAMLFKCATECLSDSSCIDKKACSWAVMQWLPMSYVPRTKIETYVFDALAAAIDSGTVACSSFEALRVMRPQLVLRGAAAASLLEAIDGHGALKSSHNAQDTVTIAVKSSDGLLAATAGKAKPRSQARKRKSADLNNAAKQAKTGSKQSRLSTETTDYAPDDCPPHRLRSKTRVASPDRRPSTQLQVPSSSSASRPSQQRPTPILPFQEEPDRGQAQQELRRRRRHSFVPRKLLELAKQNATNFATQRSADNACTESKVALEVGRRRRHSFLPRKLAELAKQKAAEAKASVEELEIRRRRSSWLPRKMAELAQQVNRSAVQAGKNHPIIQKPCSSSKVLKSQIILEKPSKAHLDLKKHVLAQIKNVPSPSRKLVGRHCLGVDVD